MDVKRRLRKGTHSCWECKRRKMRCVSDPRHEALCVGCLRRGSRCVGQEFPEELAPFQMRSSVNNNHSYNARESHTHTSHPFSSGISTAYHRSDHVVSTTGFEPLREVCPFPPRDAIKSVNSLAAIFSPQALESVTLLTCVVASTRRH